MKRAFLAGLAASLILAAPGATDTSPPPPVPDTPLTAIRDGQPMRMTYELKASAWLFIIPVTGKARFNVDLHPDTYRISSAVKTTGLADVLVDYDMGLSATGYVREDRLDSFAFISQNSDGKKNRRVELEWGSQDVAGVVTPAFGNMGDPPAQPEQKIDALDPITALINFALTPRSQGDNPCGGPIKVFDGRQLSHLHLTYAGMSNVRSDAWRGNAIECHVQLEKVAGFKERSQPGEDNLAGINGPLRMWLAPLDNGASVPVRIEAQTEDIGKVVLQASTLRFEPILTTQAGTPGGG